MQKIECTARFRNACVCLNDRRIVWFLAQSGSCLRFSVRAPDFSFEAIEAICLRVQAIVFWKGYARLNSRRRRACAWLYSRYRGVADVSRSHDLVYQVVRTVLSLHLQCLHLAGQLHRSR